MPITEINLRLVGSHEYASVEAVEISATCAMIATHDGRFDVALTLPGMALGFRALSPKSIRRAVAEMHEAGLFLGDPDMNVIFERNGGRAGFLVAIEQIDRSIKEIDA